MLTLTFHGHACWEIDDGTHRVLIDPFLTGNPLADATPESFTKLDAIIVTHGHGDHIGDAVAIAKSTKALVVSNFEIVSWFEKRGIPGHPLHIGGGRQFPFGHVKLTIAHHGSTGPDGEALGNPAGVVLTMGEKKVYHAGDTGLFLDMRLIAEMNGPIDVALLPIGDNFTMGVADAARAAELVDAGVAIPMHYDTFGLIQADPMDFVRRVRAGGREAAIVKPGESHQV
ncbi:MAG TPA: metal-dependent hydrolase [Candidatus Polarisedimenticolaceae bacterium]|nr:metal-dependent hydrolase [Candidatus Polarisedimenticolaceae bacterium]